MVEDGRVVTHSRSARMSGQSRTVFNILVVVSSHVKQNRNGHDLLLLVTV
jgi:hypothetical protein